MKYMYPAVFQKDNDGWNVRFPDIENCFTCGETLPEAFAMARDVLPLMLCEMEDNKTAIPKASELSAFCLSPRETAMYIYTDTQEYREKVSRQ